MVIVVMGVTGSGKTTIGSLLAQELGWMFSDADDFHSAANKEKMHRGIALDDADREPWLEAIREAILGWLGSGENVVLACSALKREYRELLEVSSDVKFVYLKGSYDLILQRLRARHGHFATETILADQFATLEEPDNAVIVRIDDSSENIVAEIRRKLNLGT